MSSTTPIESPRTARSTPPTSSRGFNSARGASSIAARYGMPSLAMRNTPIGQMMMPVPRTPRTPMTPRPGHEASPAVHVVVRVRPTDTSLASSSTISCTVERVIGSSSSSSGAVGSGSGVALVDGAAAPAPTTRLTLVGPGGDVQGDEQREYEFTDVFDQSASDGAVNATIVPGVLEHFRNGYSACVLCYGQTGSGKTHTMHHLMASVLDAIFQQVNAETAAGGGGGGGGGPGGPMSPLAFSSPQSPSLHDDAAAAASAGNTTADDCSGSSISFILELSYLQVYNNNVFNLLAPNIRAGEYGEVLPRPKGHLIVEPYTVVSTIAEIRAKIAEAQKRRAITPHALNPRSSRSHTLFSLRVTKCIGGTPVQNSKITLADLAGCERVKKSGVAGDGLDEAIAINKSLSALHGVIKAISSDAEVVIPFRESLLTLYLKPSIVDAYLVLVATISLDAASFSETKSSLDFATTAKRCVVSRARATSSDRLLRRGSIEAANAELLREIETLRHHLDVLQKTVALEKIRKTRLEGERGQSSSPPTSTGGHGPAGSMFASPYGAAAGGGSASIPPEMELLRDHIAQIESRCSSFQRLLRDREEELAVLESRRALADDIRKELELRQQERDEARATLTTSTSGGGGGAKALLTDSTAAVDKLLESFLWLEEQHSAAVESIAVLERQLSALRADHRGNVSELLGAKQRNADWESRFAEATVTMDALTSEAAELRRRNDALELQMLRERNERAIREDTIVLYNGAVARAADTARIQKVLEEQRALSDVIQARLSSAERELDGSEVLRMRVEEASRAKDETLRSLFALLTPQQKARLMQQDLSLAMGVAACSASQPSGAGHVVQTYDVVHIRAQNRDLQRQVGELQLRLKDREFIIEDTEHDKKLLEERYKHISDDYVALQKLSEQHVDRQEQLEDQLTDLYAYIEAHAARQQQYEHRMGEARQEWERLDEEYKLAQRTINELTMRLDRASEDLKLRDADKDVLTARLREAEAEKTTIARMRAEDRAKLTELERQLQQHQTHSTDVARRLDMAEKGRQHLASEIQHHNTHGEMLQKRLVSLKLPPETVKKHVQKLRHVDASLFPPPVLPMTLDRLADNIAKATTAGRYRFEVAQLVRQQQLLANGASAAAGATPAPVGGAGNGKARHADPADATAGGGAAVVQLTSNPVVGAKRQSPMNPQQQPQPGTVGGSQGSTATAAAAAGRKVSGPFPAKTSSGIPEVPSLAAIFGRVKELAAGKEGSPTQPIPPPPNPVTFSVGAHPVQRSPRQQQDPPKVKPEIPKLPIATPLTTIVPQQHRRASVK